MKDHEESADRQFAVLGLKRRRTVADDLAGTLPPPGTEHLWIWFLEIVTGIKGTGFGLPSISWSELRDWSSLVNIQLEPWEVRALIRLGMARVEVLSKKGDG